MLQSPEQIFAAGHLFFIDGNYCYLKEEELMCVWIKTETQKALKNDIVLLHKYEVGIVQL